MILGGIFIVLLLSFITFHPNLNDKWFLGSKPYANFVEVKSLGLFIRALVYLISFGSIAAFSVLFLERGYFSLNGVKIRYMFICCMASLLSFFVKVVKLTFNIAHQHFYFYSSLLLF